MPHNPTPKDWHARVYAGSDGYAGRRNKLSKAARERILERQDNRCLYCDSEFGSYIWRKGELILVRIHWDHQIPFVYLQRNPTDNYVAACSACNQIKTCLIFDTLLEARDYIKAQRRLRGYPE